MKVAGAKFFTGRLLAYKVLSSSNMKQTQFVPYLTRSAPSSFVRVGHLNRVPGGRPLAGHSVLQVEAT